MSHPIKVTQTVHPHWMVQFSKCILLVAGGIAFRWLIGRMWVGPDTGAQASDLAEKTTPLSESEPPLIGKIESIYETHRPKK